MQIRLPQGKGDKSGSIEELSKTPYGLLQGPRVSSRYLVSKLKHYGFDQFRGGPSTFRLREKLNSPRITMILSVHMDDTIVASSDATCDAHE